MIKRIQATIGIAILATVFTCIPAMASLKDTTEKVSIQKMQESEKPTYHVDSVKITVTKGTKLTNDLLPTYNEGKLKWNVSGVVAKESGTYYATFHPNDSKYANTKDIPVTVKVKKKETTTQATTQVPTQAVTQAPTQATTKEQEVQTKIVYVEKEITSKKEEKTTKEKETTTTKVPETTSIPETTTIPETMPQETTTPRATRVYQGITEAATTTIEMLEEETTYLAKKKSTGGVNGNLQIVIFGIALLGSIGGVFLHLHLKKKKLSNIEL